MQESSVIFDGAHNVKAGYATLMHGFSLEAKIPHPAPALVHYGFSRNEFPRTFDGPPLPRAFNFASPTPGAQATSEEGMSFRHIPQTVLSSEHGEVTIRRLALPKKCATPITEYTDGDHVWYVYQGNGMCHTDIGYFYFSAGEYVFIPKGFSTAFAAYDDLVMIGIYARAGFERPNMSPLLCHNVLREPYNEFDLRLPVPDANSFFATVDDLGFQNEQGEWRVDHVRGGRRYSAYYDRSPLSCFGYQGTPYPCALPIDKVISIIAPQVHTDPYWFTTFSSPDHEVAVSTFKERWLHSLPYHHRNTYDEFLFFDKEYGPRKGSGIGPGCAVFHPQGFMHGPQPQAFAEHKPPNGINEQPIVWDRAIMFESRLPLWRVRWAPDEAELEVTDYWKSWQRM